MPSMQRLRYAIIPTHNRHDLLAALVLELVTQVDLIYVIDNASDPPVEKRALHGIAAGERGRVVVIRDGEQPPNLTRLWTVGLEQIAIDVESYRFTEFAAVPVEWDVAFFNDDVELYQGWFDAVAGPLREHGAAAACIHPWMPGLVMKTEPDGDLGSRLTGPAFVIRGELARKEGDPLWPDISMRWWWQDTDLDWAARRNGGTLLIPGRAPRHLHENEAMNANPALGEQAGRDRARFVEKHGYAPW